jgi:hypothetical protein
MLGAAGAGRDPAVLAGISGVTALDLTQLPGPLIRGGTEVVTASLLGTAPAGWHLGYRPAHSGLAPRSSVRWSPVGQSSGGLVIRTTAPRFRGRGRAHHGDNVCAMGYPDPLAEIAALRHETRALGDKLADQDRRLEQMQATLTDHGHMLVEILRRLPNPDFEGDEVQPAISRTGD